MDTIAISATITLAGRHSVANIQLVHRGRVEQHTMIVPRSDADGWTFRDFDASCDFSTFDSALAEALAHTKRQILALRAEA